ncbi:MAG: hypothetical protein NT175_09185 [Bacteroidetes bacterium]|nr:hypothetical protein [Bacteroidota bacterium]
MKRTSFFLSLLVFTISFMMCNSKAGQVPKGAAGDESPQKEGKIYKFKRYSMVDQQGTGTEAFSFLMPVDWVCDGGIIWMLDNPGMPATAALKVSNPKGSEEFEVFPNQSFFWGTNQTVLSMFPIGSKYFGMEVRPQMTAAQALRQVVIPRFRGNKVNMTVISEQAVPELGNAIKATQQSQGGIIANAEAGKIRIEYTENGKTMEEEIYAVVESYSFPIQSWGQIVYNTNWTVDYIFSYKAEKGQGANVAKIFETITNSFHVNPNWYNKYVQFTEFLIQQQIKQIHSIGELSRMLAQTSDQIREENMQQYYERDAIGDRISENFSQYIRGVDEYYDPVAGKPVELPSGYDNAWSNPLGEYIVAEDPSFNPNIGSNLNWQLLEKKTH